MADLKLSVSLSLPDWISSEVGSKNIVLSSLEDRMRLVLRLCELNVEKKTGGPFSAAVFNLETGELISVGVNRTVPMKCSAAHAEVMAIILAEARLGSHDLGVGGMPRCQLVVNAQPCAMCCGAIPWSGITELVYAVSSAEVERLTGFDEGAIPGAWRDEFTKRGISIREGVLAAEAAAIFSRYVQSGGPIYNGSHRN